MISEDKGAKWYLFTNLRDLRQIKEIYEKRFWTEEYFRDLKTYLKGRRLKYKIWVLNRLLFIGTMCYNFVFEIGLKENIKIEEYSDSKVSFFPEGNFINSFQLRKIFNIF